MKVLLQVSLFKLKSIVPFSAKFIFWYHFNGALNTDGKVTTVVLIPPSSLRSTPEGSSKYSVGLKVKYFGA